MESFNFLPQPSALEQLLEACESALFTMEPSGHRDYLIQCMRAFERSGAATLWSTEDVDTDEELGLTLLEREKVLTWFLTTYDCKEADWDVIKHYSEVALSERREYISVTYDLNYSGGQHFGVEEHFLVPVPLVKSFGDDVAKAFTAATNVPSVHIVSIDLTAHYNQDGERLGPEEKAAS